MTAPPTTHYFTHPKTAQRVYALEYRAEKTAGVPQTIMCWLNADGDDPNGNGRPEDPAKHIVNVKPGEWLINGGDRWQVVSVRVYR